MGILTAVMLFSFLFAAVPVHAAGGASGEYLGNEVVAGGNWSTKFGTDGYLLPYKAYDGTGGIAGDRLGEYFTVSKVPASVAGVSVSDPSSVNPNQDSSGSANYPVLVKEYQTLDTDVNTNSQVINYDGSMTYTLSCLRRLWSVFCSPITRTAALKKWKFSTPLRPKSPWQRLRQSPIP